MNAMKQLEAKFQPLRTEIRGMRERLNTMRSDLQKKRAIQDAATTARQAEEADRLEVQIKRKAEDAQASYQKESLAHPRAVAERHRQRNNHLCPGEGNHAGDRCEPRSDHLRGTEPGHHAGLHRRLQPDASGRSQPQRTGASNACACQTNAPADRRGLSNNQMLKKVLLLSASAGAGHVRAAEAIEKAFKEVGNGEDREVHHLDILNYTNKVFRHLYSKAYIDLVNKLPEVPGWVYDKLDKPWKNERRRLALDKLNTRPLVKLLREYQPDLIVCTHFLPAEIVSWLKAKERLASRQVIIVTDFDVHAMWLVHHYEHYFVAIDEARAYLEALGIPAGKITVSGIPIDPVFAKRKINRRCEPSMGWRRIALRFLLSAGGFGVGSVDALIASLLPLQHRAQVVAICGRNEELKKRLTKLAARAQTRCYSPLETFRLHERDGRADDRVRSRARKARWSNDVRSVGERSGVCDREPDSWSGGT